MDESPNLCDNLAFTLFTFMEVTKCQRKQSLYGLISIIKTL
jgi:hypothetical protein